MDDISVWGTSGMITGRPNQRDGKNLCHCNLIQNKVHTELIGIELGPEYKLKDIY
jgi:hypothetical protein